MIIFSLSMQRVDIDAGDNHPFVAIMALPNERVSLINDSILGHNGSFGVTSDVLNTETWIEKASANVMDMGMPFHNLDDSGILNPLLMFFRSMVCLSHEPYYFSTRCNTNGPNIPWPRPDSGCLFA